MTRVASAFLFCLLFVLAGVSLVGKTGLSPSSIQPLQITGSGQTICTVWSLNEKQGYWATAAHCVIVPSDENNQPIGYRDVAIHGKAVKVLLALEKEDLAVLQSSEHAPALQHGKRPFCGDINTPGDPVMVYGYFLGAAVPTRFDGRCADSGITHPDGPSFLVFDAHAGPGHSGAPVLDARGQVVSVMQWVFDWGFSGGATYDSLDLLGPYW